MNRAKMQQPQLNHSFIIPRSTLHILSMFIPEPHPNAWHRFNHKLSSSRWGAKLFSFIFHHIDRAALELTNGRFTVGGWATGLPVAILTTTGAKSGQPRALPLLAIPDGVRVIFIASNWGGAKYPAWYHNLRAQPQCAVTYRGETRAFSARATQGAEYEHYWQKAVTLYQGYAEYQKRTGGRPIPIMLLEPKA
jgi:deazaflavin-dependent oxidoreductase (nitroreductase family)